jgi:hypothetical protein
MTRCGHWRLEIPQRSKLLGVAAAALVPDSKALHLCGYRRKIVVAA